VWETLIPKQSGFQEAFGLLNQSKPIGLCWKLQESSSSPGMHGAIRGRLECSCFGLASDEGGETHGVIELV